MTPGSSEFTNFSDEQLTLLDTACDQFESLWRSGQRTTIEDFLARYPADVGDLLVGELLRLEVELRLEALEVPRIEDYELRFPTRLDCLAALLREVSIQTPLGSSQQSDHEAEAKEIPIGKETFILSGNSDTSRTGAARCSVESNSSPPEFERYRIEREVGCGGMGTVYLAHDLQLDRKVALKLPHFQSEDGPQAFERFSREARSMASVLHPNICPIFDVGKIDGRPYLTMAYVEGPTLAELLKSGQPMDGPQAAELVAKMALALHKAHSKGVVHRDMKPSNVIINSDGEPIVMDFGLARRYHAGEQEITHSDTIVGSPAYMAPEQVEPRLGDLGPAADIYALGVLLYQMLCGKRPFDGAIGSIFAQILNATPTPPSQIYPFVDPTLEAICLKAMSKSAADRHASAEEFANALRSALKKSTRSSSRLRVPQNVGGTFPSEGRTAVLPSESSHAMRGNAGKLAEPPTAVLAVTDLAGLKSRSSQTLLVATALLLIIIGGVWLSIRPGSVVNSRENIETTQRETTSPVTPRTPVNLLLSEDYEWSPPIHLGLGVNSPNHDDHACISADGLTLIFMRGSAGQRTLWQSRRANQEEEFGEAEQLPETINASDQNEGPYLSPDGLMLWFASNRAGGHGRSDLWVSRRSAIDEQFTEPTNLGSAINTPDNEASPFVTADGLTLLLARGQPRRILQATRQNTEEPFGEPRELSNLNVGNWSEFPRLTSDGLAIVFVMSPKDGRQWLWQATRKTAADEFGPLENLGPEINQGIVSGPSLSADGSTLYFSSNRAGGQGVFDLWSSVRIRKTSKQSMSPPTAKSVRRVDFTGSATELLTSTDHEWFSLEILEEKNATSWARFGPHIASDNLSLWFHARDDRPTNTGRLVLWHAWRHAVDQPFGPAVRVDSSVNDHDSNSNLSDVTLSADGLQMGFCRTNASDGTNADIWLSARPAADASWGPPFSAGPGVNSNRGEWEPELSPDGLELFFHSDRENDHGGTDLWVSRRSSRGQPFGPAENLGPNLNSSANEGGAALSSDALTLLFHRTGDGFSYWQSIRPSLKEPFGPAQPLTVPRLAEHNAVSLAVSPRGDQLYVTIQQHERPPAIAVSRRVLKSPQRAKAPFDEKKARDYQETWAKHLGLPVDLENSLSMKFKLIPPGEFEQGFGNEVPDAPLESKPQHRVTLTKPYYLGTTEVTVGHVEQFAKRSNFKTLAEEGGVVLDQAGNIIPGFHWRTPVGDETNELKTRTDMPVVALAWQDAVKFCELLSQLEPGHKYRLSTEAEWEYACRAGTTTQYSWGDQPDLRLANTARTQKWRLPVGSYPANAFGLFDMHGNVWEAVLDAEYAYSAEALVDPLTPGTEQVRHILRGGGYTTNWPRTRSATRVFDPTQKATASAGFRVLLEIAD